MKLPKYRSLHHAKSSLSIPLTRFSGSRSTNRLRHRINPRLRRVNPASGPGLSIDSQFADPFRRPVLFAFRPFFSKSNGIFPAHVGRSRTAIGRIYQGVISRSGIIVIKAGPPRRLDELSGGFRFIKLEVGSDAFEFRAAGRFCEWRKGGIVGFGAVADLEEVDYLLFGRIGRNWNESVSRTLQVVPENSIFHYLLGNKSQKHLREDAFNDRSTGKFYPFSC